MMIATLKVVLTITTTASLLRPTTAVAKIWMLLDWSDDSQEKD